MKPIKVCALLICLALLTLSVPLTFAQTPTATETPTATAEATSAETPAATEPAATAEATTSATESATEAAAAESTAEGTQEATAEATVEATETPSPPITLVPFTDHSYGISGVMPDGWKQSAPGIRSRGLSASDVAVVAQQSAVGTIQQVLNALLPQLGQTTAPRSTGNYRTAFTTWRLYKVTVPVNGASITVDLGLAQLNNTTFIVLVQGAEHEYDFLHTNLFVPVLDAFTKTAAGPAPTDYRSEDVTIKNGDVTLAGTLTMPKTSGGPFAAVVLVSGSGPQNRDEVLGAGIQIAPFQLIADTLTRAGMAVLRYDDRGVGESTGDFSAATVQDFASDAQAAVKYLSTRREIDHKAIGILGHSEGGLVASMLGASDPSVAFVIYMAGPAVDGKAILDVQNARIYQVAGGTSEQIKEQIDFLHQLYTLVEQDNYDAMDKLIYDRVLQQAQALPAAQRAALGSLETYARNVTDQQMATFHTGWFKSFIDYDPSADLKALKGPVLALYGGKDVQVDAVQNAPAMTARLSEGGNHDFSVIVLPDANHLFQKADTGSVQEYVSLPPEFTPNFLPALVQWLSLHVKLKP